MVIASALLIGFEDCQYCNAALDLLQQSGFDTSVCWASKNRRTKLPEIIEKWNGDYIFHLKSYHIIPKETIERTRSGVINFHPSPPRYPGSGGLNWGLYNNDTISGVTVHYMNEKIDNGAIIQFYKTEITKEDNIQKLLPKIHKLQYSAFCDIIEKIATHGHDLIKNMSDNYNEETWGTKTGRIRDIDKMEIVSENTSKEELKRVTRATLIGPFGPKMILHNKVFRLSGD